MMILSLTLTACAHQWAPPPGLTAYDFEPVKAKCSIFARHGGTPFEASGSARFVAAAAVGHAIGDAIRAQNDFDDCMEANGWRIADKPRSPQPTPLSTMPMPMTAEVNPQSPQATVLAGMMRNFAECVGQVKQKTEYFGIIEHLPSSDGRFSIVQMSDTRIPTETEARLFAHYADDVAACSRPTIGQVAAVSQTFATQLSDLRARNDALVVPLVRQQQSWGDYAIRFNKSADEFLAQTRSSTL